MAKQQAASTQEQVILQFGYWAKFILPVDTATTIYSMLVKAGAKPVDTTNLGGKQYYHPKSPDFTISMVEYPYLADCPTTDKERTEYFDYLKTKAAVRTEEMLIDKAHLLGLSVPEMTVPEVSRLCRATE